MREAICPKCKKPLEAGFACCAEVRFMWRCRKCFKLTTAFAVPYGECLACGGELQMIPAGGPADSPSLCAVREAVQLELDSFQFYKLARDQARHWEQRAVLDRLYDAELKILHTLDQKHHVHLDPGMMQLAPEEESRLAQKLFRGICLSEHSGMQELYEASVAMERHTRDGLRKLQRRLPTSSDQQFCAELVAEGEAHISMLESELALAASL
jgi:hypothetical protein